MPSKPAPADAGTRDALLAAAADIFAEQGYQQARVRDIAARARANVAAISYHFGSKEGLYVAVLEHEAGRLAERFPIARAEHAGDPEIQLRDVVEGLLSRFLASDARSYAPRLLIREMLSPTPALAHMVEHFTRPQLAQVFAAVAAVLGPHVPPEQVRLCCFSVVGQCMFYLVARPVVQQLAPEVVDGRRLAALVDHVAGFSLAALRGVRARHTETRHA